VERGQLRIERRGHSAVKKADRRHTDLLRARVATGHAAAAPPTSVMNWRRPTSSMGSFPEPAVPA
jgi:hypothetical protein